MTAVLAQVELGSGDVRTAFDRAGDVERHCLGGVQVLPLAVLAMAAAWLGRPAACRDAAARGIELTERTGSRQWWAASTTALGFLELTLGDVDAAWTHLSAAADELARADMHEPRWIPALPLSIEAALATGRTAEAARSLTRLEADAALTGGRWAAAAALAARGRVHAVAGELEPASAELTDAHDRFVALGLGLDQARTLVTRASVERRRGHAALLASTCAWRPSSSMPLGPGCWLPPRASTWAGSAAGRRRRWVPSPPVSAGWPS